MPPEPELIEEEASPEDGVVESAKEPPRPVATESITPEEFVERARAKMEQKLQDDGVLVPPGHPDAPGLEPLSAEDDDEVDEDLTAPPVAAEEEEADEQEADDDFLINVGSSRYKSAEDAAKGIREKDLEIERLRLELQRQREQEESDEQEREPAQLDVGAWEEWAEGAVAQGAGPNGALQALNQGGEAGYHLYLKHWMADDEQRADAVAFNNQVMLQLAEQRARAAVAPVTRRTAVEDARVEAQLARTQLAERYLDFDDYKDAMDRLVEEDGVLDEQTKLWLADVAKTGLEGKKRAWEYLYLTATKTQEPRKVAAKKAETKRRRVSADAAKVAATVSTTEGNGSRTPPEAAENYALQRKNELRAAHGLPLLEEE